MVLFSGKLSRKNKQLCLFYLAVSIHENKPVLPVVKYG